jgi:homoserine dehydrogenase
VISFRGVLNSTTNLILNLMDGGQAFEEAVQYAQSIGIAETDPSNDIDGWDASVKVCVLSNVLLGADIRPTDVDRTGIRGITAEMIRRRRPPAQVSLDVPRSWKTVRSEPGLRRKKCRRTIRPTTCRARRASCNCGRTR